VVLLRPAAVTLLVALAGCSFSGGAAPERARQAPATGAAAAADGLQCLRAEGARFPNARADWRTARRRAHRYPVVRKQHAGRATVVVWESTRRGRARRVYLWWDGRHKLKDDRAVRAAAIRVVDRRAAHPERFSRSAVLLGDGSAAQARRLDRVCF
jgi:hypothetical protein